jgi:aryl-alcohol dehydrogenase
MQITAAVFRDRDTPFTLERLELDEPRPDEVLVRVEAAGLCHTDLVMRHQTYFASPLPAIFGHEGAGVVEAIGSDVSYAAVGDHVLLSYDSCGHCLRCTSGEPFYCEYFREYNNTCRRLDGTTGARDFAGIEVGSRWAGQSSFASHSVANERNVVVIDPSLPLDVLAPLGCGIQTGAGSMLLGLKVGVGASVGVFGTGSVGLSAVMAAAVAGATEIVAVDLHPERRQLALELGATHVFDGNDPDLVAQIRGGVGPLDFVLDTTSVPSVILAAIASTGARGSCGLVGTEAAQIPVFGPSLVGRSLTFFLEGNAVPQQFLPLLIKLWKRGRFPVEKMVTTYPMSAINDAEQDVLSGTVIKPVLLPKAN